MLFDAGVYYRNEPRSYARFIGVTAQKFSWISARSPATEVG